jgi:hypothetical protein
MILAGEERRNSNKSVIPTWNLFSVDHVIDVQNWSETILLDSCLLRHESITRTLLFARARMFLMGLIDTLKLQFPVHSSNLSFASLGWFYLGKKDIL